ncbi:MAG: hypothetical protein KDA42_04275 [Planctomycetales bacterium]|nr:hypothetical protein [Planctomycetales bacterium]
MASEAGHPFTLAPSQRSEEGFLVHRLESEFQSQSTEIRVLLPDAIEPTRRYRVIYVLPVEVGTESRWGDGLAELKRLDVHNRHHLICVAPTFAQLPWYCDHPEDSGCRQESHFVRAVVPAIEISYPAKAKRAGRLLLGFSKSGWGALSLLLRHPEQFERAAAWDAPLMLDRPGRYGSGPIFATPENFANYQLTRLAQECCASFQHDRQRINLLGYGNFRAEHQAFHAFLEQQSVAHVNRDGPPRKHHWNSGWLDEAVELLVAEPQAAID